MIYSLQNDFFSIEVNDKGGELWNIVDKKEDNLLRLWNGNPLVWDKRAPIVFPICGRLRNDTFIDRDKTYTCPIHGFARFENHKLEKKSLNSICFSLLWNEKTLSQYPWKFRLTTCYELIGRNLFCSYLIENLDNRIMPFNVGYHAGFNCPFENKFNIEDYHLKFEKCESPICHPINDYGVLTGEKFIFNNNSNVIPLSHNSFPTSFCLSGLRSDFIQLEEIPSGRYIRVYIKGFPYLNLWSKPNEIHFICIEPWYGLPDLVNSTQSLLNKNGIQLLQPGNTFQCVQRIEFS